jgi:hypothetical protein
MAAWRLSFFVLVVAETLGYQDTLSPEMCRMRSIGTEGSVHPLQQCIARDVKRHECGRGAHAPLVELEPSLMAACQPGAHVHARDETNSSRPQASMREMLRLLPNKTVVMVGDSTMRQFFDAVVCDLLRLRLYPCVKGVRWRCRRLWRKAGGAALPFIRAYHPDGSTWTDFHLVYCQVYPPPGGQLWAWMAAGAVDVLVFNFGMHYLLEPRSRARGKGNISSYVAHMTDMLARASAMVRTHAHTVAVFQQSIAQHFGCKSSYFNAGQPKDTQLACAGDWDSRDRTRYMLNAEAAALGGAAQARPDCQCFEFQPPAHDDSMVVAMEAKLARPMDGLDLSAGWRNALAMDVLARQFAHERIGVMRWFDITRPRSQYHRMSCCTSIKATCDCTHYCYNEVMYHEGFAEWHRVVAEQQAAGLAAIRSTRRLS